MRDYDTILLMEHLTVAEAADRLNLSTKRVYDLVGQDAIPAIRAGSTILLHKDDVAAYSRTRRAGKPGRPFSPHRAWQIMAAVDGHDLPDDRVAAHRIRSRIANLTSTADLHDLGRRLQGRADPVRYTAHPSMRDLILGAGVPTGADAAARLGLDLLPGHDVEVYLPDTNRPDLTADLGLAADPGGNVHVRWAPADNLIDPAPRLAVAMDLLEHPDPRAQRSGEELLDIIHADLRGSR